MSPPAYLPRPPHHAPRAAAHDRALHARIEALLRPRIPDDHDRAFVLRCLVDEGPAHHRGATVALLLLLERALARCPPAPAPVSATASAGAVTVPLRLSPHVRESLAPSDRDYPVTMPTAALRRAVGEGPAADRLIEHLTDGPAHHALANAVMVNLLDEILTRLGDGGDAPGDAG